MSGPTRRQYEIVMALWRAPQHTVPRNTLRRADPPRTPAMYDQHYTNKLRVVLDMNQTDADKLRHALSKLERKGVLTRQGDMVVGNKQGMEKWLDAHLETRRNAAMRTRKNRRGKRSNAT